MMANAGINVDHAYGSVIEGHPMATIVLGVDDAVKASTIAGV